MYVKYFLVSLSLLLSAGGVGYLFWQQEAKYILPTPVPEGYQPVGLTSAVALGQNFGAGQAKGLFLHFFNPDCPCSRFNVRHFNKLAKTYQEQLQFAVIIPEFANYESARDLLEENIPVYVDKGDSIATACGVYATPQAVILDGGKKLYYRGNYNKARYCTSKNSNYAEQALLNYLAGEAAKDYGIFSSRAYGCEFTEENTLNLFNL